jgi:hypothetical protein
MNTMDSDKEEHCLISREFTNPEELASGINEKLQRQDNELSLEFTDYRLLYDILKTDNDNDYNIICSGLTDVQKFSFANASFKYSSDVVPSKHDACTFESLFILSTTLGAKVCLSEMLRNGADVFQIDSSRCVTWVHAIIEAVFHVPDLEDKMVDVYEHVMSLLAHPHRRKVLMMEDSNGFRALELATKCGAFRIARAILETNGGYMEIVQTRGLQTYVKYWLSDYGIGGSRNRYIRSPWLFLAYCKQRHQASLQASGILQLEVVKKIINLKMKHCLPFLILFCLLRIVFVITLLYFDSSNSSHLRQKPVNISADAYHRSSAFDEDQYNDIVMIIGIVSGVCLAAEMGAAIAKMCQPTFRKIHWRDFFGFEHHLAQTNFYAAVQLVLYVCCCISYTAVGSGYNNMLVVMAFKCIMLPLCIFSAMFCLEFIPAIGHFAIMMQTMLVTTIKFILVDFILLSTFAAFFHDVTYSETESDFKNFSQGHYSMFKLEQSMFGFGADPPFYIQFAHLAFYFLTVILLFNFLIAVLSEAVTALSELKNDIMLLRRLGMALAIEDTVLWPMMWVSKKLKSKFPNWLHPPPYIMVRRTAIHRHNVI